MKAINHKAVLKGYINFSVYMLITIAITILMSYCYISTYTVESSKIEARSIVFDRAIANQVSIVERVDSLYNYIILINSDARINNSIVQNAVSYRKMSLLNDLEKIDNDDVIIYINLVGSYSDFFRSSQSAHV